MHRNAVDMRAARTRCALYFGLRPGRLAGPPVTSRGNQLRSANRRARRRVELLLMVVLDNLRLRKVFCRHLRELHHQHGASGEVGRIERA